MAQDRLHVVPHEDGWAVKAENTSGPESTHSTQREAIDAARELCRKKESDLVIHRLDGTIRNVYVYGESNNNNQDYEEEKEMANTRTERRERVEINDVASVGSRISWGAILAGAFVSLAMMITLGVLCSALGLTVSDRMSDRTMYYGAMICAAVVILGSLFVGGYIVSCATAGETKTESIMYGIILWGAVVAIMTGLTAAGVNVGANAVMAANHTTNNNAVTLPSDEWLTQVGLTPAQVERFHQYKDEVRPSSSATAAWWTFAGILLSMAASVGGAILGAGPTLFLRRTTATTTVPAGTRATTA